MEKLELKFTGNTVSDEERRLGLYSISEKSSKQKKYYYNNQEVDMKSYKEASKKAKVLKKELVSEYGLNNKATVDEILDIYLLFGEMLDDSVYFDVSEVVPHQVKRKVEDTKIYDKWSNVSTVKKGKYSIGTPIYGTRNVVWLLIDGRLHSYLASHSVKNFSYEKFNTFFVPMEEIGYVYNVSYDVVGMPYAEVMLDVVKMLNKWLKSSEYIWLDCHPVEKEKDMYKLGSTVNVLGSGKVIQGEKELYQLDVSRCKNLLPLSNVKLSYVDNYRIVFQK